MFDPSELERLTELVRDANIRELTLRQGEARLTLRKARPAFSSAQSTALVPLDDDIAAMEDGYETEMNGVFVESEEPENAGLIWVTAPLVGVFHPARPMIGRGARVAAGQLVGVVEAMNIINDILSETEGVVEEVLGEDGHPVEYGQPLFGIRPTA